jgi:ABC-type transport system substrate-binding protein
MKTKKYPKILKEENSMNRKLFYMLGVLVLVASMVLSACASATTEAPVVEEEAAVVEPTATEEAVVEPTATEEAAAEPTATPEPEMPAFEGTKLEAPDCDYGGKIKSIEAVDAYTVVFTMCRPDPVFLVKAAFNSFSIYSTEWLMANANADNKETLLSAPVGTGPFIIDTWNRGDSVVLKVNPDYWGEKPAFDTLVFRWATEGAARLLELQSGTVDMISNLSPDDFATVQEDPNLTFLPAAGTTNTFYLAMTNTFEPWDDVLVRQAIAYGVDRQRIVDNFYPDGSEVASHFTPCSIPNGCEGEPWYDFDPAKGKELLTQAGFPDGFATKLYYRDVFRGYLPEPSLVAVEVQTQLKENLNIDVEIQVMESGQFIDDSSNARLDGLYMLGWGADYAHVTNFLDFHFGKSNIQFGDPYPEIYELLEQGAQIGDPAEAASIYEQANNKIKELVPMVPIAHGINASASLATLENANLPPFRAPIFEIMDPGKDTLVFMQNAEPISLYCADETDGESLSVCEQIVQPLLDFKVDSGETIPALATECTPNDDSTVWTCALREGVLFHDGTTFDANDVVFSYSVGLDASSPYHVGNTGTWEYYSTLWDSLMNKPQE